MDNDRYNRYVFEHERRPTVPISWRADRDAVHFANDQCSVRPDGASGYTGWVWIALSYAPSGRRVLLHFGRGSSVRLRREVAEGWPGRLRLWTARSPSWIQSHRPFPGQHADIVYPRRI